MSENDANNVALIVALAPIAENDQNAALAFADRVLTLGPTKRWTPFGPGMVYLRLGRVERAITLFEASKLPGSSDVFFSNVPALAMAHHRLGNADEARKWLDKSRVIAAKLRWPSRPPAAESVWWNWPIFIALHREAEAELAQPHSSSVREI